jgi:hypothetical protein
MRKRDIGDLIVGLPDLRKGDGITVKRDRFRDIPARRA